MNPLRLVFAFALVSLGSALPHASGAGFGFFSQVWGNVIVATDLTEEGKALTPPTAARPVYYRGMSLGCKFGSIRGDRVPEVKEMNQFVARVLAKQHYRPTADGGPAPTYFIVVQWGYLEPRSGDLLWFLGYDANQDIGAPIMPGRLGPEVFRRNLRSIEIDTILTDASAPIYGIIVTAFEYRSASTTKPVIYWQTRIGLPANGKSMAEALPAMMLAAGPAIGRESKLPFLLDVDDARRGRVELGELEVRGVVEDSEPTELGTGAGK